MVKVKQHKLLMRRLLLGVLAFLIIGYALLVVTTRLLSPLANHYRVRLANRLSQITHRSVVIKQIGLNWQWLSPSVIFHGMMLINAKQRLQVDQLSLSINVWRSIFAHHLIFNHVMILKHSVLKFSPVWPKMTFNKVTVVWRGRRIELQAPQAMVMHNQLIHVKGLIPDIQSPVLFVSGHSTTDMAIAQRYLSHTPLPVGKQLQRLQLSGPMRLDLHLIIAMNKPPVRVKVNGAIALLGAQLAVPYQFAIENLSGQLTFNNNGLNSSGLSGSLLGQPLQMQIQTIGASALHRYIQVTAGGKFNFQQWLVSHHNILAHYIHGAAPFRAMLLLKNLQRDPNTLTFYSSLDGVTIDKKIAPLDKAATQQKQFIVHWTLPEGKPTTERIALGKSIQMAVLYSNAPVPKLVALHVNFSDLLDQPLSLMPGFTVTGKLARFNWDNWSDILAKHDSSGASFLPLHEINLQLAQLTAYSQQLHNVKLHILPGQHRWRLHIKSDEVVGQLLVPLKKTQPYLGQFSRLYWQFSAQPGGELRLTKMPAMSLHVDDLKVNQHSLGLLNFYARTTDGQHEMFFLLENQLANLAMQTSADHDGMHNQATIRLQTSNLGSLLTDYNVNHNLLAGSGTVVAKLYWTGGLRRDRLTNLTGKVAFNLDDGMIVRLGNKVNSKLGFGELLNILSVQSITQRMKTLLMGLHHDGLSFSNFNGEFTIAHGLANTKLTELDTNVGNFKLHGYLNFIKKYYNFYVKVYPEVTSSVPLIATLAGGPLVGIVTWLASKVLSPELGRIMSFHYIAKGYWGEKKILKRLRLPPPAVTHALENRERL